MKTIHYSRTGYNGDHTYTTVCGRKNKGDEITISPKTATCKKCLATPEFKTDLNDSSEDTKTDIKRRIFIESDILQAHEFRDAQRTISGLAEDNGLKCVDRVFSEVLDFAWHDLEKTWKAVKLADEIYADSALMPLCGNSYMGAPVIFNGMMERAIKEKITGKSVYILRPSKDIYWAMIEIKLMKKAFAKNKLFMYDDKYDNLVEINIKELVTKLKNK